MQGVFYFRWCRNLMFNRDKQFNHKRLINHLICAIHVPNEPSCRTHCYLEPNCDSCSFRTVPYHDSGNCNYELNNSTRDNGGNKVEDNPCYEDHVTEVNSFFLYKAGFLYDNFDPNRPFQLVRFVFPFQTT